MEVFKVLFAICLSLVFVGSVEFDPDCEVTFKDMKDFRSIAKKKHGDPFNYPEDTCLHLITGCSSGAIKLADAAMESKYSVSANRMMKNFIKENLSKW